MKKAIPFALISLIAASLSARAQIIADPDNGHYYEVISAPDQSWLSDEIAALSLYDGSLEGHLATITSADENSFVLAAVQAARLGEVYVGGYQNPITEPDAQAGWTWVNGEGTFPGYNGAVGGYDNLFADWNGGEPNDAYGTASEQWLGINFNGAWNDEGNLGLINGYVVEFDPNTIPGGGLVPDSGSTMSLLGCAATLLGLARRLKK